MINHEIDKAVEEMSQESNTVRRKLGVEEVMAQLGEESAELAKAALKYRRALDGHNPTTVDLAEAENNLQEEFADVLMCMVILVINDKTVANIIRYKMLRWVSRLEKAGNEE